MTGSGEVMRGGVGALAYFALKLLRETRVLLDTPLRPVNLSPYPMAMSYPPF